MIESQTHTHRLNWALSSLGAPDLSLDLFAAMAQRHDIRLLELRTLGGTTDLPQYFDQYFNTSPQQLDHWRQTRQIYSLDTSFGITKNSSEDREQLLAFGQWAVKLNVPTLRVFGGFDFQEPLTDERLVTAVASLNWWQEQRQANPTLPELALEVHDGFSSTQRCCQLMHAAGRKIPIIWDAHHSYVTAGESFDQSWERLGDCICSIHVKDSCLFAEGKHEECLPGKGDVPILELLKLLVEVQFTGPVALEWEKFWQPQLVDLEIAIHAMAEAGWRDY